MKYIIIDSTAGDCIITNPPSNCTITSTLSITNSIPNDSGEYVCTASNPAGNDIASISLTVYGKHSFHRAEFKYCISRKYWNWTVGKS